jgi:LruC domain-containing protein
VLLYSKASKGQPLCYYTYPSDTPPASPADIINPVLAYPGAQTSNFNGQMGHDLVLKYWNEETGEFEDEFPAGVSIGMFFLQEGLDNKGNVVINTDNQLEGQKLSEKTDMIFYANGDMNQKLPNNADAQRAITMYDGDQFVALCFESEIKHEAFKNGSWDYTDIIMGLYFHEAGSFDTNLPRLPEEKEEPTDETNVVEYWGTLAFEDNWPYKHDYDMNDVVIYYKSRVYKSVSSNEVVKIEDEFTVAHDGATFINGFGYQFAQLSNSQVTNVSVETQSGLSSTYANGLEADQNHPTILLYDNNKVASEMNATFKVTTTFASGVSEASVIPPYNPFIFIQSNSGRGRELHLVNNTPTAKMDEKLFQSGDDQSQPASGLFYVSDNSLPFAIHLSHTYFEWPNESKIITSYYPQFADWAKSKGTQNNSWYLSPEK